MVFTKQEMVGATYQKMIIEKQILPEVLLLKPKVFADERGFFVETLRESILEEVGIPNLKQQKPYLYFSESSKSILCHKDTAQGTQNHLQTTYCRNNNLKGVTVDYITIQTTTV